MAIQYSIPKPTSQFVDPRTGLPAREWFLYLNNIFGSVSTFVSSGVTASSGALSTNQLTIGDGPSDIKSLTGLSVSTVVVATSSGAIATPVGAGTSTQVLHGNATTFPFYSSVSLTADVSGILPIANGGTNTSLALNNARLMMSSSGAIVEATSLTNGQIFIGSTGSFPVASTLTASTGITITNSPGSIAIAAASILSASQTFCTSTVFLNATSSYFDVVNTGSIGGAGQTWLLIGTATLSDSVGVAAMAARIWDGTNVFADVSIATGGANLDIVATVPAIVTTAAATTYKLSCRDITSSTGVARTTGNASTANKATSITAIRLL